MEFFTSEYVNAVIWNFYERICSRCFMVLFTCEYVHAGAFTSEYVLRCYMIIFSWANIEYVCAVIRKFYKCMCFRCCLGFSRVYMSVLLYKSSQTNTFTLSMVFRTIKIVWMEPSLVNVCALLNVFFAPANYLCPKLFALVNGIFHELVCLRWL